VHRTGQSTPNCNRSKCRGALCANPGPGDCSPGSSDPRILLAKQAAARPERARLRDASTSGQKRSPRSSHFPRRAPM
jgi:hypothetical protein